MTDGRRASEVRQVELVDAALHIIATRGISELTTRSLARHVGLSSGAIFRHFASIEALLDAVVSRVEVVLESTYPPATVPPIERLDLFVEARSTTVGNQLGILRLMTSDQFVLALPKGGSERLATCRKATREFLRRCIQEGQATGEIRADIEATSLAIIVMGAIQMLALSSASPRQQKVESREVRKAIVLLARPARHPSASELSSLERIGTVESAKTANPKSRKKKE